MSVTVEKMVLVEVWETWCGHWVALSSEQEAKARKVGSTYWCNQGHAAVFRQSEVDRLKHELADAQEIGNQATAQAAELLKRNQALERESRLILKRAKAGVCSFCHRTFSNVQRHMQSKH